jgi:hypothetical protein
MTHYDALRVVRAAIAKADQLPGDNPRAEAARGRRTAGLTAAGVGYLAASRTKEVSPGAAEWLVPKKAAGRAALLEAKSAKIAHVGSKGGAALTGAGLLLAGEGALADLHHRDSYRRAVVQAKGQVRERVPAALQKAFDHERARLDRESELRDSQLERPQVLERRPRRKPFDAERSRHDRSAAYVGAATGGAVVVGAGGVKAGMAARKVSQAARGERGNAANAHGKVQERLHSMAQTKGTPATGQNLSATGRLHREALGREAAAGDMARKAKRLTRVSRGAFAGAAALGAVAAGVHHYDRRGGGLSYGY